MELSKRMLQKIQSRLIGLYYYKILYIDLATDSYSVVKVGDNEWMEKLRHDSSDKISDWFKWFANSDFCHPKDRQKFLEFTDLEYLKNVFAENNDTPVQIVYDRKYNIDDVAYRTVKMDILPDYDDEGHQIAVLFCRDIFDEKIALNDKLMTLRRDDDIYNVMSSADNYKILIVEDNELNRDMLSAILNEEGYSVIEAENGKEGIDILKRNFSEIAVVLLDIQMPVMDGYKFLEAARNDAILSHVPVVVLTAEAGQDEEERCLNLGAVDFIRKPYRSSIIKMRIDNIIALRASTEALSAIEIDDLTGVYTRQAFIHRAEGMLRNNPDKNYVLILSDMCDFKQINENYGNDMGDEILRRIGHRLQSMSNDNVLVGRYSGDQFVNLMQVDDDFSVDLISGRDFIKKLGDDIPDVVVKYGVNTHVDHMLPITTSCDRALLAVKSIKNKYDKIIAVYDDRLKTELDTQRRIESCMHKALEEEQFVVYYQPKHDASTGRLVGAEALIRWIHPEYGFMSPGAFIPLFEKNGFVAQTDYYVWTRTCKNLRNWIDEGLEVVPVSVNASKIDFNDDLYLEKLNAPVGEFSIPKNYLHIEVTESLMMEDVNKLVAILTDQRAEGYKIELDDFGAGYSSINSLSTLPIDVVKLDMSFMKQLDDPRRVKVLEASINLASNLGLKTIAEGVETEEQLELLKKIGVDNIQGYYFSKPLPEAEFKEYLKAYSEVSAIG